MKLTLQKKPETDLDYVEIYAIKLKKDNSLFEQQKKLIESQLKSSSSVFRNSFGKGNEFKLQVREYLRKIRLLS